MTADWVYIAIALLFGIHLVVLAYAFRGGSATGVATPRNGRSEPADAPGDDTVRCPNCATQNEHGYRFCRECLAELPGGVSIPGTRSTPQDRRLI